MSHVNVMRTGGLLDQAHAISGLAALAQPTRLAIFRLLVKHEPIGVTAGVSDQLRSRRGLWQASEPTSASADFLPSGTPSFCL
jgi:hypothetical protein